MMGIYGYKTKKELKTMGIGRIPDFIETSMFGPEFMGDGTYTIVGPDPYNSRKWYATVTVENGVITGVK